MSRRTNLRRDLATVARAQSGYFTAAQALAVGYAYPTQKYHVEHGNWEKVERGIYRFPEWPTGRHDDLVCRTLWSHNKAVVSHETALAVHELGDVDPALVHLTVPPGFRARAEGVVLHRGELSGEDIQKQEGFNITPPLRSLADVAGGDLELDHLARAIRDALDRGIVTRRQLRAKADEIGPKAALRVERALTITGVD
jgi:predicted transcriptional regulator of viral defense system